VDDNRDAADSLALLLKLAGFEVHTAYDGQEAVEAARVFRPGVVLLDLAMPRMNGYEVARRLREEVGLQGLVVIAVTGYGRESDIRRSREAGFRCHLTKPVDPLALLALLAGVSTASSNHPAAWCSPPGGLVACQPSPIGGEQGGQGTGWTGSRRPR
jgi:CheY-like chemotaxis protein